MASDSPIADPSEDSPPATQVVDELYRQAALLPPHDRLRLVARLWSELPRDHRSTFVTLQLQDLHVDRCPTEYFVLSDPREPLWPKMRERFFAPDHNSSLYSAPRRFDLATIFVVTAAYSLMLGGLTAMGMPPIVKVVITAMITIVAATQALFRKVANPRGISIVTGTVAYTVISWCIWVTLRRVFPNSFFVVIFINGIIGGAIIGYLAGTLVGGVFLVADRVRQRFEGGPRPTDSEHVPADNSQLEQR